MTKLVVIEGDAGLKVIKWRTSKMEKNADIPG